MLNRIGRAAAFAVLGVCLFALRLSAQSPDDGDDRPAKSRAAKDRDSLGDEQEQVAKKFKHLEEVLIRLREQSGGLDPRRAKVLTKAVEQSKDEGIAERLEQLTKILKETDPRYAPALQSQTKVQEDLARLLDLLLSEDRSKRLASEKERIREYIKQLKRIINEEKIVQDETAGNGDPKRTAQKQDKIADETGGLARKIAQAEGKGDEKSAGKPGEAKPGEGQPGHSEDQPGDKGTEKGGDKPDKNPNKKGGDKAQGEEKEKGKGEGQDKQGDGAKGQPDKKGNGDEKGNGNPNGKSDKKGADKEPEKGDAKSKSKPEGKGDDKSEGKPDGKSEGKAEGKPKGKAQGKGQGQGQDEDSDDDDSDAVEPQPGDTPPQKRIEQAEQKMREARRKLEEAKRPEAAKQQDKAIEKLRQAVAALEEILRQLREEETARMLAMLEARFRKMLEMQIDVYEKTKLLENISKANSGLDETAVGPVVSKQGMIVVEADKALALLKAEGSAVAFPEAVTGMRDDMDQVRNRLADKKVGEVTQGIEEDVITALEELIAALEKAQKDLEAKKSRPAPPGGEPVDPPLVDTLAELKMIRALQMRVNRRTQRFKELFAELATSETVEKQQLIKDLAALSEREERIYRVTREIVTGRNR